jgi:RND family efflux transporter MFP subunit
MNLLPRRPVSLLLVFVLAGIPLGCKRAEPEEESHPAPVKVEKAKKVESLEEWTELLGTTQPLPDQTARISAGVEGQVVSVLSDEAGKPVKEGQQVAKGDIIAQLDAAIPKANLAKVKAALQKTGDQEKQAKVAVKVAEIEVNRLKALKQKVPVAESDIEKADLQLEDAQLKRDAIKTDRAAGQAEVVALEAQLKLYTLRAPLAGRLGQIQVKPGQSIPIGTTVAEVTNLTQDIDVLCYAAPAVIGQIHEDRPAHIITPDAAIQTGLPEGEVVFKDTQADPLTGNFAVKVRFPNGSMKLPANTVARVRVLTRTAKNVYTLPEEAILEDQEPPAVVVVDKVHETVKDKEGNEKEVEKRIAFRLLVKLGIRDRREQRVEIVELTNHKGKDPKKMHPPVAAPDYVIEGGHGLKDGDEVKIEEEKKEEEKKDKD